MFFFCCSTLSGKINILAENIDKLTDQSVKSNSVALEKINNLEEKIDQIVQLVKSNSAASSAPSRPSKKVINKVLNKYLNDNGIVISKTFHRKLKDETVVGRIKRKICEHEKNKSYSDLFYAPWHQFIWNITDGHNNTCILPPNQSLDSFSDDIDIMNASPPSLPPPSGEQAQQIIQTYDGTCILPLYKSFESFSDNIDIMNSSPPSLPPLKTQFEVKVLVERLGLRL